MAAHQGLYSELIMPPYRIVLSDDQTLFLQSIKKNLEEIPGIEVIGEIATGPELLDFVKKSPTDMVILDVRNRQQMEIVKQMKTMYPKVKILILTMDKTKTLLIQAILANADGYMIKENAFSDLLIAIERIKKGGSYFCNIISSKMADIIRDELCSKIAIKPLSPMQQKVLTLLCQSKSYREIAELLSLRYNTVRNYMVTIKNKLNLKTKPDLIKFAIEQGYNSSIDLKSEG
jgi:DNA-binding NarL/FixJ family response regulator